MKINLVHFFIELLVSTCKLEICVLVLEFFLLISTLNGTVMIDVLRFLA